ncbi:MAG: phosphopantetheine-binding protein [Oscillospiraceae bacterium]|nr:phosphopantetheine-binding protein [Oscillospiraceae bacterium]
MIGVDESRVIKVINRCRGKGGFVNQEISKNSNFIRDFEFSSVDIIRLVVELENEFDVEIDDGDLLIEKLGTYYGIIEVVKNAMSK